MRKKNFVINLLGNNNGQKKKDVKFGYTFFLNSIINFRNSNKFNTKINDFRNLNINNPYYESILLTNNDTNFKNYSQLSLGGDHSIGLGTVISSKNNYKNLKVIWIDAHADINTRLTSFSGNFHGMPVSCLLGINHKKIINPSDFCYIGLRSIDCKENYFIKNLKKKGLLKYDSTFINKKGINYVLNDIKKKWKLPKENYKFHLSFDIDALDPKFAPCTGVAVNNGLTPNDVKKIIKFGNNNSIDNHCNLDICEINPSLSDINGLLSTHKYVNNILNYYLKNLNS